MSKDMAGDFLTILRNGLLVSKRSVQAPFSKLRQAIAEILKEEGFIKDDSVVTDDRGFKVLHVQLKYVSGESVMHEITRISKPSRRVYKKLKDIRPVIGGLGISILSTNKGVMTDKKAHQHKVGGEIICTVW